MDPTSAFIINFIILQFNYNMPLVLFLKRQISGGSRRRGWPCPDPPSLSMGIPLSYVICKSLTIPLPSPARGGYKGLIFQADPGECRGGSRRSELQGSQQRAPLQGTWSRKLREKGFFDNVWEGVPCCSRQELAPWRPTVTWTCLGSRTKCVTYARMGKRTWNMWCSGVRHWLTPDCSLRVCLPTFMGFEGDTSIVVETKRFLEVWWAKKVEAGMGWGEP